MATYLKLTVLLASAFLCSAASGGEGSNVAVPSDGGTVTQFYKMEFDWDAENTERYHAMADLLLAGDNKFMKTLKRFANGGLTNYVKVVRDGDSKCSTVATSVHHWLLRGLLHIDPTEVDVSRARGESDADAYEVLRSDKRLRTAVVKILGPDIIEVRLTQVIGSYKF